jgi:hypothetical protein
MAAYRPPHATTTLEAAKDEQERDLDPLDVAVDQRVPWPVNRRQEPAGGESQRTRPVPVVLDAGRRAARVSEKQRLGALGCGGGEGIIGLGKETEIRRRAARPGWVARGRSGRWRRIGSREERGENEMREAERLCDRLPHQCRISREKRND